MEQLLSKEDIKEILENNKNNPVFKYYGVRLMPTAKHTYKDVIAVSEKNNLILIKGNEDTGNIHIRERHNFWSTKNYIVENPRGEIVFQDQSRFPDDVAPIEFIKIADEIYSKENFIKDNPHPMAESFDLYIGEYSFDELKKVKLLLYKGTKIIHSLFLSSSSYNKKRATKFPFSRGNVEFHINPEKKTNETFVPYYDTKSQMRYGIVFEKYNSEDLEKILILIFNPNDYSYYHQRVIGERKLIKFKTKKHEEVSYQHGDLRAIEKVMLEIDNDIKSGNIKLENE